MEAEASSSTEIVKELGWDADDKALAEVVSNACRYAPRIGIVVYRDRNIRVLLTLYGAPVFILDHHYRRSIQLDGYDQLGRARPLEGL